MSAANGARFDVIVVGGGHNGLTCAAYLARSRRRVLVLEAEVRELRREVERLGSRGRRRRSP